DYREPSWIDDIGSRVRDRLQRATSKPVIGHLDWQAQNVRWTGRTALSVDDWDSVATLCEPAIAGAAGTVFAALPSGGVFGSTPAQTDEFLASYQLARGVSWSAEDVEIGWAAGLWVMSYDAKKETLGGVRGYVGRLRD